MRSGANTETFRSRKIISQVDDLAGESPFPILQTNRDGVLLYANKAALPLIGELATRVGDPMPELFFPFIRESAKTGQARRGEILVGDRAFAFEAVPDRTGPHVNLYGHDITRNKQWEESVVRSEQEHRLLFELAGTGKAQGDPETGRILKVNEKYCEITGYSAEELLTKTFLDITHPDDREDGQEAFQRMIRGESKVHSLEKRYIRKDGSTAWVEVYAGAIRDARGHALYITASILDITERKRAEKALRRYELLAANSRDIVLLIRGSDGRILEANAAAVNMYGYSREELLSMTVHDLRAPELRRLAINQIIQAKERGILFETIHRRKDGSLFPVEVSSQGATIDGETTLISVIRDITHRKQGEEEMRQANRRLELLSRAAHELLQAKDPVALIQDICEAAMRLLGCDVFFNYLHSKEREKLRLSAYAGISVEKAREIEWMEYGAQICGNVGCRGGRTVVDRVDEKEDDPQMALIRSLGIRAYACHALASREGEIFGTLSFGACNRSTFSDDDLSLMKAIADQMAVALARREEDSELRKSEETLRKVLDTIPIGVWFADSTGRIRMGNPKALEIWGGARDVGMDQYDQFEGWWADTGERIESHEWALARALLKGETSLNEIIHIKTFDGQCKTILSSGSPIRNEAGDIIGALTTNQDISEYRRTEREREEYLREMVKQGEELARSNKDLEHFAYIASHDLQEPLRTIRSYLQILEKRYKNQLDKDADEFIGYAVDGAARLQDLIFDLLAFSRVGTQGMPLILVQSQAALDEALQSLHHVIAENRAQLTSDPLPPVLADSHQLSLLFQNLIGNAIKFHRPGEVPRVHISARDQSSMSSNQGIAGRDEARSPMPEAAEMQERGKGGEYWVFSVTDNGIGIDARYFERIFTIFQRLHGSSRYKGSGVGLAICKRIVERHGGRIWVDSQEGSGATFYFTLPKA